MPSIDRPLFTVVMATYGRGRHILPSVRSVLRQDLDDFELLVVGDCCPTDVGASLEHLADDRVRWTNLAERCQSQSGPNNEGIRLARGRLIAYIGHDDVWDASHLSSLARLFDADPAVEFGVAGAIFHLPHGVAGSLVTGVFVDESAKHAHFFPPSSLAHRRTAVDIIGPWRIPESIIAPVDCDLLARAAAADLRFASTRRITVHKFAAGHRYLSYLAHESHEQEAMLAALGSPRHYARIKEIVTEAVSHGHFMTSLRDSVGQAGEQAGDLWRANLARKGLRAPASQPLADRLVIRQTPSPCALDWQDGVRNGLRWSSRSPRPKILVPVTADGLVRLDLEIAHDDPGALTAFPLRCNESDAVIVALAPVPTGTGAARKLLSAVISLRPDGPSVLELMLPDALVPRAGRRGIAIGDMTLTRMDVAPREHISPS